MTLPNLRGAEAPARNRHAGIPRKQRTVSVSAFTRASSTKTPFWYKPAEQPVTANDLRPTLFLLSFLGTVSNTGVEEASPEGSITICADRRTRITP